MYDYEFDSEWMRMRILQCRAEISEMKRGAASSLPIQAARSALDLRHRLQSIIDLLDGFKETLQEDYKNLEWLPENFIKLININSLLAEFDLSDKLLEANLLAIERYLQAQHLDAVNHDQRERARHLAYELNLTQTAILEITNRKPAKANYI